ncbi:phage holin family protein [Alcaligenaceae bacterium CGII-47]|nr:phage holin family protein [Alcaligenaceae bacterium CGII-47]
MSLSQALSELGGNVLAMAHTRLALFSLEAAEARQALFQMAALATAAVLCLFLAVLVATLSIALYFWPTEYRFVSLGVLAAGYAVIGLGLCWRLRRLLVRGPMPFAATVAVLEDDAQVLRRPARGQTAHEAVEAASDQAREPL